MVKKCDDRPVCGLLNTISQCEGKRQKGGFSLSDARKMVPDFETVCRHRWHRRYGTFVFANTDYHSHPSAHIHCFISGSKLTFSTILC